MSTVRTIIPPGVAQANQLKARLAMVEQENAELRAALQAAQLALASGDPNAIQLAMQVVPTQQQRMQEAVAQGATLMTPEGGSVQLMTRENAVAMARQSQAGKAAMPQAQRGQLAPGGAIQTPGGGTVRAMPRPASVNAATPRQPQPAAVPFNGQAMPPAAFLAQYQQPPAAPAPAQMMPAIPQAGMQYVQPAPPPSVVIDVPSAPAQTPAQAPAPSFPGSRAGAPLAFQE